MALYSFIASTPAYQFINGGLLSDLGQVIGVVGEWFTSNPFLSIILTVSMCGLAIKLIRSVRNAIM